MKILILKASAPGPYKDYKQQRGGPPQSIFSLAAATPDHYAVEMVDETGGMKVDRETNADLIVMHMSTPDAIHAYEIADGYREQGKTVIFGGLHASFMVEEALEHGDSVIIGEAENVWDQVLNDFEHGTLKQRYQATERVDLSTLNPYPTRLIPQSTYDNVWSVLVSRGCLYKCSFCMVHRFFDGIRYRPVGEVVDEVRNCGAQWLELHADNLTHDRDYAMELFSALKPLNINWVGESTIRIAEDEELLNLAVESGMRYLLVGLETPSREALSDVGKGFVKPWQAKEYVARLHEMGVIVDAAMLFGFDQHNKDIFTETLEFSDYVGADLCDGIIVIPFPGSKLYAELDEEGRILTRDWSLYDGGHAVFQPAHMTAQELEDGAKWYWEQQYKFGRILKRKARQVRTGGFAMASMLPL